MLDAKDKATGQAAAKPTIKIISNLKSAPAGQDVELWALVDPQGETKKLSVQLKVLTPNTGATFPNGDSSPVGARFTNMASVAINVPFDWDGDITVSASIKELLANEQGPPDNKTITFWPWYLPDEGFGDSFSFDPDKIVAPPIAFNSSDKPDLTNTILFRLTAVDAAVDNIPDAEVHWSVTPQAAGWLMRDATTPFGPVAPFGNSNFYSTLTNSDGVAQIRLASLNSKMLRVSASVVGTAFSDTTAVFFNDASDTRVTPLFDPVQIPLLKDNILDTTNLIDTFVTQPPNMADYPSWNKDDNQVYVYFEGSGPHIYGPFPANGAPSIVHVDLSSLYNNPDADKVPDQNSTPHNYAILFNQGQGGTLAQSKYAAFATTGQIRNEPDPNVQRNSNFPLLTPLPNPGVRGWITFDDQILKYNGLRVQISALPTSVPDGWHLFFRFYLNGAFPDRRRPKADSPYYPDPRDTTKTDWITVDSSKTSYETTLPYKLIVDYAQLAGQQPKLSYIEYFVVPAGQENEMSKRQYAIYQSYYLNTIQGV